MGRNLIILLAMGATCFGQPIPVFSGATTTQPQGFVSGCGSGSGCGLAQVFEASTGLATHVNTADLLAGSFVATQSGIFCQADLYLVKLVGSPTMSLQASLWSDFPLQPGTSLGTTSIVFAAASVPGSLTYISFKGISANVTAGTRYWLVLASVPKGDPTHEIAWQYGTASGEKTALFNTGDFIWTTSDSQQYWMRIYISPGTRGVPGINQSWVNTGTTISGLANNAVVVNGCCPAVVMGLAYYSTVDATRSVPLFNGATNGWSLLTRTNWISDSHGWLEWWYHQGPRWGTYTVSNHWSSAIESAQMWTACVTNVSLFDPITAAAYKTNSDTSITNIDTFSANVTNELSLSFSAYPGQPKTATLGAGQTLLSASDAGAGTFTEYISSKYGFPTVTNIFTWSSGASNGMGQITCGLIGY